MKKVLVANRGEIAVRIVRALREMDLATATVYSAADAASPHLHGADEALYLGESVPSRSYLNAPLLVEKALACGADAVHPGYGFLAESPAFAEACAEAGLTFIGPPASVLRRVGDKRAMKAWAGEQGFPVVPGSEPAATVEQAVLEAERLGFPVMLKAVGGGGGRGIRPIRQASDLALAFPSARREAEGAFGRADVFVEAYVESPRHVEVQVLADDGGAVVHCHDRECSIQRRYQKIVEEAPSPALDDTTREALCRTAVDIMAAAGYRNAGTVEFLLGEDGRFWFLEVNPRIQVEHTVTEAVTGVDLVKWQVRLAAGERLDFDRAPLRGHAMECRVCAEDPAEGFRPSPGRILFLRTPAGPGVRVDSGVCEGYSVPAEYDPLLFKVITHGPDRDDARSRMMRALEEVRVAGVQTTACFLLAVVSDGDFAAGDVDTGWLKRRFHGWQPPCDRLWEALATVAVMQEEQGSVAERIRDEAWAPSPWRRLGKWRLGRGEE